MECLISAAESTLFSNDEGQEIPFSELAATFAERVRQTAQGAEDDDGGGEDEGVGGAAPVLTVTISAREPEWVKASFGFITFDAVCNGRGLYDYEQSFDSMGGNDERPLERTPAESKFWETVAARSAGQANLPQDADGWTAKAGELELVVDDYDDDDDDNDDDDDDDDLPSNNCGAWEAQQGRHMYPNVFRHVLLATLARALRAGCGAGVSVQVSPNLPPPRAPSGQPPGGFQPFGAAPAGGFQPFGAAPAGAPPRGIPGSIFAGGSGFSAVMAPAPPPGGSLPFGTVPLGAPRGFPVGGNRPPGGGVLGAAAGPAGGRPMSSYMLFCQEKKPEIERANPGADLGVIMQKLAEAWKKKCAE